VIVYLSGPMTGYPEHNYPAFKAAREQLQAEGIDVLCPAEAGYMDGWDWSDYLRRDLVMVMEADAVLVLPGWQESKGARLEVHVARELGIPIREHGAHYDLTQKEPTA
jgi:hypothetical protein